MTMELKNEEQLLLLAMNNAQLVIENSQLKLQLWDARLRDVQEQLRHASATGEAPK